MTNSEHMKNKDALDDLQQAFLEGFKISGEGWNGEYPHEGVDDNIIWEDIKEYYSRAAISPETQGEPYRASERNGQGSEGKLPKFGTAPQIKLTHKLLDQIVEIFENKELRDYEHIGAILDACIAKWYREDLAKYAVHLDDIKKALQNNAQGVDVEALKKKVTQYFYPNMDSKIEAFVKIKNTIDYLHQQGHLRAIPEWQPIETAPKDGADVLLYWQYTYHGDKDITHGIELGFYGDGQWDCGEPISDAIITHWMPLPAAPKKGE